MDITDVHIQVDRENFPLGPSRKTDPWGEGFISGRLLPIKSESVKHFDPKIMTRPRTGPSETQAHWLEQQLQLWAALVGPPSGVSAVFSIVNKWWINTWTDNYDMKWSHSMNGQTSLTDASLWLDSNPHSWVIVCQLSLLFICSIFNNHQLPVDAVAQWSAGLEQVPNL